MDQLKFSEIYEKHFSKVYNYISYRINNHSDTEDLVSNVFMLVIEKYSLYDPEKGVLEAWIIGIAKNAVNDYFREKQKFSYTELEVVAPFVAGKGDIPEEIVIHDENNRSLMIALNKLNDRERQIISLKYAAGLRNKDIASIMELSESNVGVLLFRSLNKMKDIIEKEGSKCRIKMIKNGKKG